MLMIGSNEIGGGFVRLAFTDGTRRRMPGEALSAAEIKSFHNYRRMIEIGKIAVYPPSGARTTTANDAKAANERHVVSLGFGRYDVIEGRKLTDKSLTKDEAEMLAAI
jgi:hypothetical protein